MAADVFSEAAFGCRVGPLAASGLKGVEAEAYIGAVDHLDDLPGVLPRRRPCGPTPIFVCKAEVVFGEHNGQDVEIGGEVVKGRGYTLRIG